ncbi:hypothetical protein OG225_43080 (plasmid) [Nocardia sp. NBC_01377]|uniref:hypothetical protein n=1 Tax=Nocardia sp. NBC_01377 TaxID=2903595 RepID=UPI002F91276E
MITTILGVVGVVIVAGIGVWVIGDTVARWLGLLLLVAGAGYLIGGLTRGVAMICAGLVLWLVGHWLFAYKHHGWRSAAAQRVFAVGWLRRVDPTRGWAVPVVEV